MAQDFMRLDVQHDLDRVRRELGRLDKAIPWVMSAALNKTAAGVRTDAAKPLNRLVGIGLGNVKKAINLRKASPGHLTAFLEARERRLNMIRFMTAAQKRSALARKRGRAIRVGTAKRAAWGKPRVYGKGSGVFIGNEGRTLFIRMDGRKTIRALHGPSLSREMVRAEIRAATLSSFNRRWHVEIERAIKAELARTLGKGRRR